MNTAPPPRDEAAEEAVTEERGDSVSTSESETLELPSGNEMVQPATPAGRRRAGFWREASGALALGLCVLAAVVLGFQIVAWIRDTPGPGAYAVVGHLLAGGLALLAQWFADRRRDWPGWAAVIAVFVIGAVALWMFWWA
jgi:drug/metabolite transporter (DMT)-like permease